jgi:hypothetical protein
MFDFAGIFKEQSPRQLAKSRKNNLIFYPYYRKLENSDKLLIQENIYDNCY